MRKNAVFILILSMFLMLTGCAAPHANAQGESGSDIIIRQTSQSGKENANIVVTLKPRATLPPTVAPTATPTPTPTASPTVAPTETPAVQTETEPALAQSPQHPAQVETPTHENGEKYVYLTFDDGPSDHTQAILDILTQKNVVGTFFVIGNKAKGNPDAVRAIAAQGSCVGNHTQTHKTDLIYETAQTLLDDIEANRQTLIGILGSDYTDDLFRFPYGSSNRRCREYRDDVLAQGYRYFDWNALNGDAESSSRTAEELLKEFKETVDKQAAKNRDITVLMHDTNSKDNTVVMLPDAIQYLKDLGYTFRTLENVPMP